MFHLRDYQQEAIDSARKSLSKNRATIMQLATGLGKTVIASNIIELAAKQGGCVLFMAHTDELVLQFEDKLHKSTGMSTLIEKAERTAHDKKGACICASVQSISRINRLERYKRDRFSLIITDEVHRGASDTYARVYDYFKDAKMIGLTATPYRTDKKSLGDYFDDVCCTYDITWAIENGWLVPLKSETIPLAIDLSEVSSSHGDFKKNDLADAIEPVMEQVADALFERGAHLRKGLVFLPTRAASQKFTRILQEKRFDATHFDGMTKNRAEVLREYGDKPFGVMCNPLALSVGYDEPTINWFVDLSPTKSNLLYTQKAGRVVRPINGHFAIDSTVEDRISQIAMSEKPHSDIYDFLYHGADKNLSHPACLFAKTEEVEEKMVAIAAKGGSANLKEVEEEAHKQLVSEREQALIDSLNSFRGHSSHKFDPVLQAVSLFDDSLVNWKPEVKWEGEDLSEKQEEYLTKNGFDCSGWKKGYASKVMDSLAKRREEGLASPKMVRCLLKNGYPQAHKMSFKDAKAAMDRLSKVWERNKKYNKRRKR